MVRSIRTVALTFGFVSVPGARWSAAHEREVSPAGIGPVHLPATTYRAV